MRDDFDALIADRFAVLVDVAVPDIWSRVESKLADPTAAPFPDDERTLIEFEAPKRTGEPRNRRPLIGVLVGVAAAATLIGALVVVNARDDTDRLRPVDSTPATLPRTTVPAPVTTVPVPVDSTPDTTTPATTIDTSPATTTDTIPATTIDTTSAPPTVPTPPAVVPSLWVDLEPGATAPLPPAPIPTRHGQALVWTGTELIVWGGFAADGTVEEPPSALQDGAAFDPKVGTWRLITPSPDGVRAGVVLWTGTEMLVWSDGTPDTASAAYNPATDTWRSIADLPVPIPTRGTGALWIGDEAVLLPDSDVDQDGHADPVSSPSFAYDPATDGWRRLADGPWGVPVGYVVGGGTSAVWTGTTIITITDTDSDHTDSDAGIVLNGYDPATDTWRVLEGLDSARQPVVFPGRDGAAATVAFLPLEPETPVELFDAGGNAIGELAGRPAELALTCDKPSGNDGCLLTSLRGVAVGGEVLFWYSEDGWAFDPEAQTWRSLPLDGRQPGWDGTEVVAAGDLLFAWGDDRDGLVHRAAIPG